MASYAGLTFLLCWSVLCFALSVWCSGQTIAVAWQVINKPHDYRGSRQSESMNQTVKRTMICTGISSSCFTAALLVWTPSRLIEMLCLGWPKHTKTQDCANRHSNRIFLANTFGFVFLFLGYLTLLSVTFERFKMVFDRNTLFGPSKRTVLIVRSVIAVCITLTLCQVPTLFFSGMLPAMFVAMPTMITYPFLSSWVAYRYLSSTQKLASSIDSTELSKDLLNVAVRLTIVAMTAISTTLFSLLVSFLSIAFPSLAMVRRTLWVADALINAGCLLGTFADARTQRYYRFMFGRIHDYWLDRLV